MRRRRSNCHSLSGKRNWVRTKIWKALRRTDGATGNGKGASRPGISQVLINRGVTILVAPCFLFRFAVPLARQYEVFKRIMNRDFSDIAGLPRRIMLIALLDKGVMCAGMPVYKGDKLTGCHQRHHGALLPP